MRPLRRNIVLVIAAFFVIAVAALLFFLPVHPAGFLPSSGNASETVAAIQLPAGFTIEEYASVPGARSMTMSEQGILYVGTRSEGSVYAVLPNRTVIEIASGMRQPNGVTWRNGSLYVAEVSRILRYDDVDRHLDNPPRPDVVYDGFPSESHHGWKFIRFGPDGKLYVPVGAPCNLCNPGDPYASITRMNPDGRDFEIFARGVRNTVGFDWHPVTGDLWFTDNGRDWYGDDRPPDELNRAPQAGMHFGYPFCHGAGIPDDEFTQRSCNEFTPATQELGPHVASLGMRFYTGEQFPEKYRGGIFIAEHGSWNREVPIGYRVMFVQIEQNQPVSYEVFAEGWLQGSIASGRPVDVLVAHDGSLLVSDDKAGKIYRIGYAG